MKNKRKIWIFIFLTIFLSACHQENQYSCDIKSMLIEKSVFPEGTVEDPIDSPLKGDPLRSASRAFYYQDTSAWEYLVDYPSQNRAKQEYRDFSKAVFSDDKYRGGWETPDSDFVSSSSTEMHYACGHDGETKVCRFIARYDTYNVYFQVEIADQGMTTNDFISSIKVIDQKMKICINFEK
jgi:hypothetical protein